MLTPDDLRKIADKLDGVVTPSTAATGKVFMCHVADEVLGEDSGFCELIQKYGCPRDGHLGFRRPKGMLNCEEPKSYYKKAMPVRFMFLEFLALEMETR